MHIYLEFSLLCSILTHSALAEMNIYRESEIKLHQDLLKKYNHNVRPIKSIENATIVTVSFSLLSLKEFDDRTGHVSICGDFKLSWMDLDLSWNSSQYNGIYLIHVPKDKIWTPTLTLFNAFYETHAIGYTDPKELVFVFETGKILYNPGAVLDVVCHADVTYFPFDHQICHFNMTGWYYGLHELAFELYDDGNIDVYDLGKTENSMWDIKDMKLRKESYIIYITITTSRKPLFYIYNIILPINFICLLNIFVFLLPSNSGERVGFSVTMLLSLAVFLTIVSDRLPESSNPSILGLILLLEFSMSGLILVFVILGLRCYHTDSRDRVPVWIQRIMKCCSQRRKLHEFNHIDEWINVSKFFDTVCFCLFISVYAACILGYVLLYCKQI